jgi:predicted nucleic acid-binding protein
MKTINLANLEVNISSFIEQAKQEDLLLKLNDGSEFLLCIVDDFDLEIAQTRKNEKLMQYLSNSSEEEAVFSLDDIKQELGLD